MKVTPASYTSAALDADGLADNVAYVGGGYALSANSAGDGLAHKITVLNNTANDHSAKTLTVTGTNPDGRAQSETLAGPGNAATVTTINHYLTVTSVTISSTTGADTFDIGWNAESVSPTYLPAGLRGSPVCVEIFCVVPTGASATYSVQYTADAASATPDPLSWLTHATITGKTASFDGQIAFPVLGVRLKFTAAGTVRLTYVEATPA